MSLNLIHELNVEISKSIAEAYDKGCLEMLHTVINLAEINGGQITVEQLIQLKTYAERTVIQLNSGSKPEGIPDATDNNTRYTRRECGSGDTTGSTATADHGSDSSSDEAGDSTASSVDFSIGEGDGLICS